MKKKRPKSDNSVAKARVNRRVLSVVTLAEADDSKEYWARQTPQARLRAAELMRRINYGSAATGRLQRLLEVVHPKKS